MRLINDANSFSGLYQSVLPQKPAVGETMRIHIFIDHSIMDIFVNNQYAFSIRIFPTDTNAEDIEAFSDGGTTRATSIKAWKLGSLQMPTAVTTPTVESNIKIYSNGENLVYENVPERSNISVYSLCGRKLVSQSSTDSSKKIRLMKGQIYIVEITGNNSLFTRKILM